MQEELQDLRILSAKLSKTESKYRYCLDFVARQR